MAKLTMKAIQDKAKTEVFGKIETLFGENALQFANGKLSVETEIDTNEGTQRVFVEIGVVAKNWNATKTAPAFDPIEKRAEWLAEIEVKENVEKAKALAKAAKSK